MCTVRIDILMQGVESFGEGDTNFVVGHMMMNIVVDLYLF